MYTSWYLSSLVGLRICGRGPEHRTRTVIQNQVFLVCPILTLLWLPVHISPSGASDRNGCCFNLQLHLATKFETRFERMETSTLGEKTLVGAFPRAVNPRPGLLDAEGIYVGTYSPAGGGGRHIQVPMIQKFTDARIVGGGHATWRWGIMLEPGLDKVIPVPSTP